MNHDAQLGAHCNQSTRYNFGMDALRQHAGVQLEEHSGCPSPPLVGVRTLRSPCGDATVAAQSPDGVPLKCDGGAWSADYRVMFYG